MILSYYLIYSLLVILLSCFVYYKYQRRHIEKYGNAIPGPHWLPLIGNFLSFIKVKTNKDMWDVISTMSKEYSKIFKIWLGPKLLICINDPEYADLVLQSFAANEKDPLIYQFISDFTPGIFTREGEEWKELRKPLNKLLHVSVLDKSQHVFNEKTAQLCSKVEQKVGKGVFDIHMLIKYVTLDMICATHMGVDHINELEENKFKVPENLERAVAVAWQRIIKPQGYINFIYYNFTKEGKESREIEKTMHNLSEHAISTRIGYLKELGTYDTELEPECYTDIIINVGKKRNKTLTEMARMTTDFLMAGYEASALVIAYTVLFLAFHPEYQDKAYEEQKLLFPDEDTPATFADISRMSYLTRAVKESLRLIGVVGVVRRLKNDIKLDHYTLPTGASVYCMFHLTHRDRTYWERPNEFYPDHFLPEKSAARPKGCYIPFSLGARRCPGSSYAHASMLTVLSRLIRKFKFTSPYTMDTMEYQISFLLESAVGFPVEATYR